MRRGPREPLKPRLAELQAELVRVAEEADRRMAIRGAGHAQGRLPWRRHTPHHETYAPPVSQDQVRDRWLARRHRRGIHVPQRAPLRARRRRVPPADRRRRPRRGGLPRPALRLRALRARLRRGAGGARHPQLHAAGGGPDPGRQLLHPRDERRRRDRHHRQPQPVDRQRLQGQGRYRRRRRAGDAGRHRGDHGRPCRGRAAAAARLRRRRAPPAWSRSSTRTRASATSWPSIVDIERIRAAKKRVLVEPLYGSGSGWFTRLLGDGDLTIRELHTERNPFFGGVNPEPIRPNVDEWLERDPALGRRHRYRLRR